MNPNVRDKILAAGDQIGHDIAEGIVAYIEFCNKDYASWNERTLTAASRLNAEIDAKVDAEMKDRYESTWEINVGEKYIRLVQERSAHGFVMRASEGKFQRGDLLKSAGWSGPTKNKARGNILAKKYGASSWTGIR